MIEAVGGGRSTGARHRWLVPAAVAVVVTATSCSGDDAGDGSTAVAPPTERAGDPAESEGSEGPPERSEPTSEPDDSPSPSGAGAGEEETSATLELEPATTTTTTPEDRAVSELLLDDVPLDGFTRADEVLGAGPLDLDAAARAEQDVPAERAVLETRRFQRGASRAWLDPSQDVVYVAVYDFADADRASAYWRDGTETLRARGATPFEVPEVDGAAGFTTVEESEAGTFTAHAVAFVRDDLWVLVLVGSPGSGRTPDDARVVAAAQAARL